MGYQEWFEAHGKKHRKLVDQLKSSGLNPEEIIAYFDFENMVKKEPGFCPLYTENKKCHEMEQLNCYLCACPFFRFNDHGIQKKGQATVMSCCEIDSKKGQEYHLNNKIHQDCSNCLVPHKTKFIHKMFQTDWFAIMKECNQK